MKNLVLKTELLEKGDHILAGVSGGADSVCLFLLLEELSSEIGFDLAVVHIEHGLRGQESKDDAAFVEELCRVKGVRFWMKEVDVRAAVSTHISTEEAARILRREAYREAAALFYGDERVKVALAHNANDQAETVLMNLTRGTGIKGLGGMSASAPFEERGNHGDDARDDNGFDTGGSRYSIIRPLLGITRAEIEEYLAGREQAFRTDATNGEDVYTRNRIRHQILPALEEINPQAVRHIGQAADILRANEMQYDKNAVIAANKAIINGRLNRVYAASFPAEIQVRLIRAWIYQRYHTIKNITSKHIYSVRSLFLAPNGTKADIPGAFRAVAEGEWIVWEEKSGRNAPRKL